MFDVLRDTVLVWFVLVIVVVVITTSAGAILKFSPSHFHFSFFHILTPFHHFYSYKFCPQLSFIFSRLFPPSSNPPFITQLLHSLFFLSQWPLVKLEKVTNRSRVRSGGGQEVCVWRRERERERGGVGFTYGLFEASLVWF